VVVADHRPPDPPQQPVGRGSLRHGGDVGHGGLLSR
jgi:hypothetical protein